jgi:hypothetical protein
MICRAYKHVEMARVQHLKYTNLIIKARQDSLGNVVHSKRTRIWRSQSLTKHNLEQVITTVL